MSEFLLLERVHFVEVFCKVGQRPQFLLLLVQNLAHERVNLGSLFVCESLGS